MPQGPLLTATLPPAGADLRPVAFAGREEVSRPFLFTLDLLGPEPSLAAADFVGKPVGVAVAHPDEAPRQFHGLIRRFAAGPVTKLNRRYRAEVVPWLWFLTRSAACKIFQNKSTPDIAAAVFDAHGFSDYEKKLTGTYPPREYCVQYRETAFDFVSRLLEEDGIFYFFKHAEGKHTLVLADAPSAFADCDPHATVPFRVDTVDSQVVSEWDRRYEYPAGKMSLTDYNFETPATSLLAATSTVVTFDKVSSFEVYDYPGRYKTAAAGKGYTKVRMEEAEAGHDVVAAAGRCSSFYPGGKFTLEDHPADAGAYLITSVDHSAVDSQMVGGGGVAEYRNAFTCVPDGTPVRPARVTPRPVAHGLHPAKVVGPAGEEIYTDKYARVKVQFPWDRDGKNDENSSCWLRVAELVAGNQWGMVFTPRIGQEVLVDFLEGDPDRPVVVGRVYNAQQMPPYPLPDNMTQSGLKTRSTKEGGAEDFNELRFEDKKGEEQVYFHAQKDFVRIVENDDKLQVLHDQFIETKNNRELKVLEGYEKIFIDKGDRERTVSKGADKLTVETGDRTVTISKGNLVTTVDTGDRKTKVAKGNDILEVSLGDAKIKAAAGAVLIEATTKIELKVGSSVVTIDPSGVAIAGAVVKVDAKAQAKVSGLMTAIGGTAMLELKGAVVMIN